MTHITAKPPPGAMPAKHSWFFIVVLGALMGFTSLSTDVYLPAMPQMQRDVHGDVELTITGFLVGFALAQLAWGPISDRIGRRIPLFIGMLFFAVGSIGCALSDNIQQIVLWRIVQAFGACTGPMLARAMVRDLYGQTEAARMLSTLTIVMAIAPIIGPLLGGQMLTISSWHGIFWLLAAIGALMFLAIALLPETRGPDRRSNTSLWAAFADYRGLLRNRAFLRPTLSVTFFYMGVYAFIAGSPFVYIRYFGVLPQLYGWLFGLNIAGVMALSFVNRSLVRRFSLEVLLRRATAVGAISMSLGVVLAVMHIGGLTGVIAPVFVFMTMNGIVAASATAAALEDVPEIAGSASALIGSLQYGSGIVSSALLAWLADGTPRTMIWIMGICAVLSAGVAFAPATRRADLPMSLRPEEPSS
jgi:DHA1 family bicyclomycin/chloramphenicol resistance-like MFS transporter